MTTSDYIQGLKDDLAARPQPSIEDQHAFTRALFGGSRPGDKKFAFAYEVYSLLSSGEPMTHGVFSDLAVAHIWLSRRKDGYLAVYEIKPDNAYWVSVVTYHELFGEYT
jgi:hypothetical protein